MQATFAAAMTVLLGSSPLPDLDAACRAARETVKAPPESHSKTRLDKYRLFTDLAKSSGKPSWTCPELDRVLQSPDRDFEGMCEQLNQSDDPSLEFTFESPLAQAAWAKAQQAGGAAGYALLRQTAEWPEHAFRDCDRLRALLDFKAGKTGSAVPGLAVDVESLPPIKLDGPVTATGGISLSGAESVIQQSLPQIRYCASVGPNRASRVKVELSVDATGAVVGVNASADEVSAVAFRVCMLARTSRWKFPSPKKSPAKVSFTIVAR